MRFPRTIAFLLALFLIVACGGELAVTPAAAPTPTAAPTRVPYELGDLVTVERGELLDAVTGNASVVPKRTDDLFFTRDGRVAEILVDVGDQVETGQVLARLEQSDLGYQIKLAQVDLELAELRADEARKEKAETLEQAIVDKEVERARIALERLETERKSLEVSAPYAGRIGALNMKPAAEITAFLPVVNIVGTDELMLLAEFTGSKASRLAVGQAVDVQAYFEESLQFGGTLTGRPDASATRFVIEPQGDAPKLEPDATFKVIAIFGRAENVLTLPVEAVKTIGERRYVLIAENGQLRRTFVETGIETDGVIEIRSGVEEGQKISAR